MATLQLGGDEWTKAVEKMVEKHDKDLEQRLSNSQLTGTRRLSAMESRLGGQYAAMLSCFPSPPVGYVCRDLYRVACAYGYLEVAMTIGKEIEM